MCLLLVYTGVNSFLWEKHEPARHVAPLFCIFIPDDLTSIMHEQTFVPTNSLVKPIFQIQKDSHKLIVIGGSSLYTQHVFCLRSLSCNPAATAHANRNLCDYMYSEKL